ncbi:GNAT family N-acetyltransferase [Alkalimonas sp. MEB108]|uniref:GNAT family N-acetyltransferase n=1 Tax=Alkalimonas cellulosilytica TaxID=3058395 RepID=A0ABU7J238_9GAMM|nr:GNAT family N-acetyltransferase [Alkalimonas sp. MEB108]MEE2000423.1 GNAT family N-acetyltransferase [Alkalimonas sp. MEB108]
MLKITAIQDQNHLLKDLERHLSLFDAQISIPVCNQFSWVKNWTDHYLQEHDKLFICIHKAQKKTVAYYSLYLKKVSFGYELRFIGSGEPEHTEVSSEFQDFVIQPEYLQQSLALFTEQVKQLSNCYRISFDKTLITSYCYQWLKTSQNGGWRVNVINAGNRYLLALANSEEVQIRQLVQSGLRRHARRFIDNENVITQYCNQQELLVDFFSDLIHLHSKHWQKRSKPGAFSSQQFRDFHYNFAKTMLRDNKLLLFKLVHQKKTIAVYYGFYHQATLYYYQSGISEASPLSNTGIAMHLVAMRHAREHGATYYDLMAGSLNSYKANYVHPGQSVLSISSTHPILFAALFVKRLFRKAFKMLKWKSKW